MKEGKETQLSCLRFQIFIPQHNAFIKKRKLSIIASGRVGLNYEDFSKKINKKYLISYFKKFSNAVFRI